MTETEFDIVDELYFVTSFPELAANLNASEKELCQALQVLLQKGYIKSFFPDPDTEVDFSPDTFQDNCHNYFYLATKAGLLAHNSR
ncbi:MAG TPA: hypothetical protein VK927_04210 [Adhaeribacter sp.]|nr:hypothetical protein [Adhaeribacter sp.]